MTVDERIKVWAAWRLKIDVERVEHVLFVHEEGTVYSEDTEDPPILEARVTLTDEPRFRNVRVIDLAWEPFDALIRELMQFEPPEGGMMVKR